MSKLLSLTKALRLLTPIVTPVALGLALIGPASAAISVTDVQVTLNNGKTTLSYRLNEPATAVDIAVSNGSTQHFAGPTAKGLNSWDYPGTPPIGASAVITATGAPETGTGGATWIVPPIQPPGAVSGLPGTNVGLLTNIAVNKRAASPLRGHIYTDTGLTATTATEKYLTEYASDGTQLKSANISTGTGGWGINSGSFPYGIAISPADTLDRTWMSNRSAQTIQLGNADLSKGPTLTGGYYTGGAGLWVTPNSSSDTSYKWNIYQADNKTAGIRHYRWDDAAAALVRIPTQNWGSQAQAYVDSGTPAYNTQDIAVDDGNTVLYKCVVGEGGGVVFLNTTNTSGNLMGLNKWTSSDNGDSWTLDDTWGQAFAAAVATDGVDTSKVSAVGLTFDKDFSASNLSGSHVWVAVATQGATDSPFVNRIYKANAATGAIDTTATIDLTAMAAPTDGVTGVDGANNGVHFIEMNSAGNMVITLQTGKAGHGQIARYFAVVAPNTAGPTTEATPSLALTPPLGIEVTKVDNGTLGNSGAASAQVTYTVTVFDSKGITADNVQVTADFTALGGSASTPLTNPTISGDGTTAVYVVPVPVPAGQAPGNFTIPFTAKATSNTAGVVANASTNIYQAYKYDWKTAVDGSVNASPAANGTTTFVGTDNGKIYAFDSATGNPVSGFGSGGVHTLGEPVRGEIVSAFGKLFVTGSSHVFILKNATTSNGNPLVAKSPDGLLTDPSDVAVGLDGKTVFVASGNKIYGLNANTGAKVAESADLGAKVNKLEAGPSGGVNFGDSLVVAGTEPTTGATPAGQIVMLKSSDLTPAFTDINTGNPLVYTDTKGGVKSRPVFSVDPNGANFFVIGSATGIWAINADLGDKIVWEEGGGGGANVGGNPYQTTSPVDATIGLPVIDNAYTLQNLYLLAATRGSADIGGQVLNIASNGSMAGQRVSFGGYPVTLTPKGSGFAGGVLTVDAPYVTVPTGVSGNALYSYLGSDSVDQRFFGILTTPDADYSATPAKVSIFDPKDTATFPGETAGAFNDTAAWGGGEVVVGSAAGIVYGFPKLNIQTPLLVTGITPANGASGISGAPAIAIAFNSNVADSSVTMDTVKLLDETGTQVDATTAVSGSTVTLTPNAALTPNKTYTVVVTRGVATSDSAPLHMQTGFSSSFYTGVIAAVPGDLNGDKAFDASDVALALRIVGGLDTATSDEIAAAKLITGNDTISLTDALKLWRSKNGK